MSTIEEAYFYEVLDFIDKVIADKEDITEGWWPTIEELELNKVADNMQKFLPLIAYFSADPWKGLSHADEKDPDYIELVGYCKKLINDNVYLQ